MKFKNIQVLLVLAVLSFVSCNKTEAPVCDGSSPTYDANIKSIIDNNCTSCHDAGSGDGDYTTYAAFASHRSNGKFESSVLINQDMPESSNNALSQADLSIIKCWVQNGFPEN